MSKKVRQTPLAMLTPKQKAMLDFIGSFSEEKGYAPSQQEIAKHFGFKSLGTVQNYLIRLEREGVLHRKGWNSKRGMQVVPSADALSTHGPRGRQTAPLAISSSEYPRENHHEKYSEKYSDVINFQARRSAAQESKEFAESEKKVATLPLLGRVAAGRPIEAIQNAEGFEVPLSMLPKGKEQDCFVLRIVGNSMIEDGILEGDYVIVKRQSEASNGQTVVALLGGEATIKRYYRRGSQVELHPANPAYDPILINSLVSHESENGVDRAFRIEGVMVGLVRRADTRAP